MEITLTQKESEEHFFNALCNGLSYVESGYGLELVYDNALYKQTKELLEKINPKSSVCYEDILMAILKDGGSLSLQDNEGDEELHTITLKDVHERVQKTPTRHLMDAINERDDAATADVIIQTVFLGEVIYG
jgi:hypothetical protein